MKTKQLVKEYLDAGFSKTWIWKRLRIEVDPGLLRRAIKSFSTERPRRQCEVWLIDLLAGERPINVREIIARGRLKGYSRRTIYRAAENVKVKHIVTGYAKRKISHWSLKSASHSRSV